MHTNLIRSFKGGEQALAWAVVEQAIFDYRATNCQFEKDYIIDFLQDYLPYYYYILIRGLLK